MHFISKRTEFLMLNVSMTKQPIHGATGMHRGFSDNRHGAQVGAARITRTGVAHFHRPLYEPGGYREAYRPVQWEGGGWGNALSLGRSSEPNSGRRVTRPGLQRHMPHAVRAPRAGRTPTATSMRQGQTSRTRSSGLKNRTHLSCSQPLFFTSNLVSLRFSQ